MSKPTQTNKRKVGKVVEDPEWDFAKKFKDSRYVDQTYGGQNVLCEFETPNLFFEVESVPKNTSAESELTKLRNVLKRLKPLQVKQLYCILLNGEQFISAALINKEEAMNEIITKCSLSDVRNQIADMETQQYFVCIGQSRIPRPKKCKLKFDGNSIKINGNSACAVCKCCKHEHYGKKCKNSFGNTHSNEASIIVV